MRKLARAVRSASATLGPVWVRRSIRRAFPQLSGLSKISMVNNTEKIPGPRRLKRILGFWQYRLKYLSRQNGRGNNKSPEACGLCSPGDIARPVCLNQAVATISETAARERSDICAPAARSAGRPLTSVLARTPEARRRHYIGRGPGFLSPISTRRLDRRRGRTNKSCRISSWNQRERILRRRD